MPRYFLTLSYDGTRFNGWQSQDNTTNTVQQVLEEKLSVVLQERLELVGCGRTDAGVNARDFVVHFDSENHLLRTNKMQLLFKFNNVLPREIAIQDLVTVNVAAHARFSATQRVYYYYIHRQKDPFIERFSHYVYGELDFDRMNTAAAALLEYRDFTSFSKLHGQTATNDCRITKAVWHKCNVHQWRFAISADRFLRGMVRAIVGTLLLVGRNKISIADFKAIIEAKDRKAAGSNVPPQALFLAAIIYPKEIYNG